MAALLVAAVGGSTWRAPSQRPAGSLHLPNISSSTHRSHAAAPIAAAAEPPAAAAAAAPPAATAATATFHELAAASLDTCTVQLRPCAVGHGLYLTAPAATGDVVLSVPVDRCLLVDYAGGGLRLPPAEWPRLRKGVQKDDALPWDILQASGMGERGLQADELGSCTGVA